MALPIAPKPAVAVRTIPMMPQPAQARPLPQQSVTALRVKPYTMIAGAFTRKDNAMITITRLRQAGYDAFLGQSQPLFQVWVNGRPGTDPAKELARIKQYYKDAYLKLK